MKKLKNILAALKTLRQTPSKSIADAWQAIKDEADINDDNAQVDLIDGIISAVVAMAKDDEDKAGQGWQVTYNENDQIEVWTGSSWEAGVYAGKSASGHLIGCDSLWYGYIGMSEQLTENVRKPATA